jgi:hypothetical protein
MKSAATAAPSAVVAISMIKLVASCAHTKSGMRVKVMPGARILMIVTLKFKAVIVELTPMTKTAAAHIETPAGPSSEIGGYSAQPASGAPISSEDIIIKPATGKSQ